MEKKAFAIGDLTALVGIGRTALYAEIKAGRLVSRKVGRRTVVLEADLDTWLKSLPSSSSRGQSSQTDGAAAGGERR